MVSYRVHIYLGDIIYEAWLDYLRARRNIRINTRTMTPEPSEADITRLMNILYTMVVSLPPNYVPKIQHGEEKKPLDEYLRMLMETFWRADEAEKYRLALDMLWQIDMVYRVLINHLYRRLKIYKIFGRGLISEERREEPEET